MCTLKTKSIEGSGRVADSIKVTSRALGVQLKENRVTVGSTVVVGAAGGAVGTVTGGVAGA